MTASWPTPGNVYEPFDAHDDLQVGIFAGHTHGGELYPRTVTMESLRETMAKIREMPKPTHPTVYLITTAVHQTLFQAFSRVLASAAEDNIFCATPFETFGTGEECKARAFVLLADGELPCVISLEDGRLTMREYRPNE